MTSYKVESCIWAGIVLAMVTLRFASRLSHFKAITRLQIEDWLMLFITCLYVLLIVFLNIDTTTNSNLIDPADIPNLTPEDITERIYGSKIVLCTEQFMCAVQWGTKACLLILYWRMTENIIHHMLLKITAVYIAVTYVVMEILYFAVWCRPFHDYWQTPTNNVQCTTALHHLIVNLIFNLTADILLMSIPLPLLLRAHLEIKRKVLLILPFSLGFFSMICAILSKHLSFSHPFSPEWIFWYTREASTIMIVSNMPYAWGLFRRVFRLKSFWAANDQTETRTRGNSLAYVPNTRGDTSMQMFSGELKELRGVPLSGHSFTDGGNGPIETLPAAHIEDKKTGQFLSWLKRHSDGMTRLDSRGSQDRITPAPPKLVVNDQIDWQGADVDKKGTELHVGPSSSPSSSAASIGGRSSLATRDPRLDLRKASTAASAVDKLYRLDDEDLMVDVERGLRRPSAIDDR